MSAVLVRRRASTLILPEQLRRRSTVYIQKIKEDEANCRLYISYQTQRIHSSRDCGTNLKGQYREIFHVRYFSSKVPTLDPDSYPKFFSPNLVSNSWSQIFQLHYAVWSQISPLHLQRGVKSLCCIMQRRVKSCRCILDRGTRTCHCIFQWRVRSY
jgi:hypothetical protein